ncbi:MAG: serine/threonine protein phosphatase [Moraxellaceae bacterium]|nr:MAG: serine/threonine protein phosphatase [Moraxellaceae bacterium]
MSQTLPHVEGFDVIGDVHGCADLLRRLLVKMGYQESAEGFTHPLRKVIFLGDLIDRGPAIREVVSIAKSMVENGNAYAVVGNHEYNALVYDLLVSNGVESARRDRLGELLAESLSQYENHPECWQEALAWFKSLPLHLEFDDFRIVHACWDQTKVDDLAALSYSQHLNDAVFLQQSTVFGSPENIIVERLLRGTDLKLADGLTLTGDDGVVRQRFRTKFWTHSPKTYHDVVFQPDRLPEGVDCQQLTEEEKKHLVYYEKDEKPLFVGHYWRQGKPRLICSNIVCLDYSAVKQGKLVAYRFDDGDKGLDVSKLWWVK